jgi:hypothetical protein
MDIGSDTNFRMILHPANVNIELTRKGKTLAEGFTTSTSFELLNNSNMRIFDTDYGNVVKLTLYYALIYSQ